MRPKHLHQDGEENMMFTSVCLSLGTETFPQRTLFFQYCEIRYATIGERKTVCLPSSQTLLAPNTFPPVECKIFMWGCWSGDRSLLWCGQIFLSSYLASLGFSISFSCNWTLARSSLNSGSKPGQPRLNCGSLSSVAWADLAGLAGWPNGDGDHLLLSSQALQLLV